MSTGKGFKRKQHQLANGVQNVFTYTPSSLRIILNDKFPDVGDVLCCARVKSKTLPSPADIWEADDAVRFVQGKTSSALVKVILSKVRKATVLGRARLHDGAMRSSPPGMPLTLRSEAVR